MKSTKKHYQPRLPLKLIVEEQPQIDLQRLARLLIGVARQRQLDGRDDET